LTIAAWRQTSSGEEAINGRGIRDTGRHKNTIISTLKKAGPAATGLPENYTNPNMIYI
jgi:hypothetical protein